MKIGYSILMGLYAYFWIMLAIYASENGIDSIKWNNVWPLALAYFLGAYLALHNI